MVAGADDSRERIVVARADTSDATTRCAEARP